MKRVTAFSISILICCVAAAPASITLDGGLTLTVLDGKAEMAEVGDDLQVDVNRERQDEMSLWRVTAKDLGGETRWLELVLSSEDRYQGTPGYWPGFQPADLSEGPYETAHRRGSMPLAAMWDDIHGTAIGLEPHERVSWIWHTAEAAGVARMSLHIRIVVEPGAEKALTFVSFPITGKWGHREALEKWYALAPEFYTMSDEVDPRTYMIPTQYAAWWGTMSHWEEVCRRNFGGWEWCYAPFKRTGDIMGRPEMWDFESPVPIRKRNMEELRLDDIEAFHERRREMFARGERGGPQMLFYVPAMIWCEEALAKERYADSLSVAPLQRNRIERWVTGWDTGLRVLPWHTSYGEQTKIDLREVAEELDLTGYAFDTATGWARHPGPAAQKFASRAWDDEVGEFVREGIAVADVIKYTQTLRHSSGRRLSVVPNLGFAWYTVSQVADAGMKEANPWQNECAYNDAIRYGMGAKPVCWWEGYGLYQLIQYENMTGEQVADAYMSMSDLVISESLKWGYVPTLAFTRGIASATAKLPALLDCIHAGWEPVPAATVDGASWVTRYGNGLQTRLALGNESLETVRPLVTVDNEWLGGATHIFSSEDGAALTNRFGAGATVVSDVAQAPRQTAILRCRAVVSPALNNGEATATVIDTLATRMLHLQFGQPVPGGSTITVDVPEGYEVTAVNAEGAKTPRPAAGGELTVDVHGHGVTWLEVILTSQRFATTREELQGFEFVRDGAPNATVVLRRGANDKETLAAERMVGYFRCYYELALDESTEVVLPVAEAGADVAGPMVLLDSSGGKMAGVALGDEPWRISLVEDALVIAGRDGEALLNAVSELMRVLDGKYRYPGYHVGMLHNTGTGLVGRWIDLDGTIHGTPPEEYAKFR